MESDLTIRKIERADADRLLHEFRRQGWAKPREVLEGYYEEQRRGERTVFIADCQGETAGYITLRPTASAGPFAGRGIPELTDLIVFIRFQRRGIGSRLLEAGGKSGGLIRFRRHPGRGPAQRIRSGPAALCEEGLYPRRQRRLVSGSAAGSVCRLPERRRADFVHVQKA